MRASDLPAQWQLPEPDAGVLYRQRYAASQLLAIVFEQDAKQLRQTFATESFDTNTNDRRVCCAGLSKQPMKVRIECYDDSALLRCAPQDYRILCRGETNFTGVDRIDTSFAQQ